MDNTTIVLTSEYSRTPKLNSSQGKDHNFSSNSFVLIGHRVKAGVFGKSGYRQESAEAWLGHAGSRVVLGLPDDAAADPFVVLASMSSDSSAHARVFATIGVLWAEACFSKNESSEALGWTLEREERSRASRRALEPARHALQGARRALDGTGEGRVEEVQLPDLRRHFGMDGFFSGAVVEGALRVARCATQSGPAEDVDHARRALHDAAVRVLGEGLALAIARNALIQRVLGYT
jgi:hypothetical protein